MKHERKSVAICAYLFDMFCIESRRLSPTEFNELEKIIAKHSSGNGASILAEILVNYLRRQTSDRKA